MSTRNSQISNQDYGLIKRATENKVALYGYKYGFNEKSIGFEFLVLEKMFSMQEDEIIDAITDTIFLKKFDNADAGPDRGIDAIQIDLENNVIHLLNFKFSDLDIERVKDKVFPSSEVNNIIVFIQDVFQKNKESFSGNTINTKLAQKINEIWKYQDEGRIFQFRVYLISNYFKSLPEVEDARLSEAFSVYRGDVNFSYILASDISDRLVMRKKYSACQFRGLSNNFFDKIEAGNRALVLEVSALDLIRITSNDENVRNNVDIDDDQILRAYIEEAIFDDNVRKYLKLRTNINKNIKNTALDINERRNIFFYNNGITITCDKINYQGTRNPIIKLDNFQVVNGGQTVHALRSAFDDKQEDFDQITLLCKIYETQDASFKGKIAEFTNSQNPVKDRDIRSIDLIQIKLEKQLELLGYFYERKKNQHEQEERTKRIDAEKLGQALMSYQEEMPAEAKNKKSIIFGEKYEDIFNDKLNAEEVLKIFNLYNFVEDKKINLKNNKPYLMHATYYILFFMKRSGVDLNNEKDIEKKYISTLKNIEYIIDTEKKNLKDEYIEAVLFKSNRPKDYLTQLSL